MDLRRLESHFNHAETYRTEHLYGCEHYKRKCQFITPCCNKKYVCRLCHDEKENHELKRNEISQIECLNCTTVQNIRQNCSICRVQFGRYFCSICNLFDDEDKSQFHCTGCGICRTGGKNNYFHCDTCGICLPRGMRIHRCIENVSRTGCPICLEDLHTSRTAAKILSCGHLIHTTCFKEYSEAGQKACPQCRQVIQN